MAHDQGPQFRFEHQLRLEVDRVLDDLVFRRAPIQSRLLHYLMERTISDPSPPTQYEIAVDGLGKTSEYDIENDSYPRVQVSRLKRNLQNYYARNGAGDGLKVEMQDGSYRLRLVPSEAPVQPGDGEAGESEEIAAPVNEKQRGLLRTAVALSVAIWVIGLIGLAVWFYNFSNKPTVSDVPKTALVLDINTPLAGEPLPENVRQGVEQVGRIQLRNSLVSRSAMPLDNSDDAKYLVAFSAGLQDETPALFLTLFSDQGEVLFAHTISSVSARTVEFERELEASLVYITSPTGAIAKNELQSIDNPTATEYTCFLSIENNRTREGTMAELMERCIDRFPDSSYAAYWHARQAFAIYQASAAKGEPIAKDGQAWAEVNKALAINPTNAFANFVAAKVELASGQCDNARAYINRALERGASYPAMVASANADGAACPTSEEELADSSDRLRALARFTPDPDPLLHLYLMLALLAVDDRAAAADLAETLVITEPTGSVELSSDLLRQALTNRSLARAKRAQLRSAINLYIWNPELSEQILDRITG